MGVFNLVGGMGVPQIKETVGFNTDSMFDLMTGDFVRTFDGKFACRGGFSPALSGVAARQGSYKSTFSGSLAMRLCSIYQSEFIILDSEDAYTRSKDRILRSAGNHKGVLTEDNIIALDAKNRYDLESMRELIHEIGEKKKAMGKDAFYTTPFLDTKTGERIKVYRPTIIFIDSWSMATCNEEKEKMLNKGLDDGASKTLDLLNANKKSSLASTLSRYASEYGIEIMTSAHYGDKVAMDPYAPKIKAGQFMNLNEAPKKCGSQWGFLTSPLYRITSCTKLVDDAKMCKYKITGNANNLDLNEIMVIIDRCKNNASGLVHPFVVSQADGLVTDVSDYHYLRQVGKGFSMTGNNVTHQPFLMPDVNIGRNTFRDVCQKDPRVTRALQLGAQLYYIQNNWNATGWEFSLKVSPDKLVEVLLSDKNKMSVDRILASRGYWLPEELTTKDTPEFMSVIDILEFASKNGLAKPSK